MPPRRQPVDVSPDELDALRRQDRALRELNNRRVQPTLPMRNRRPRRGELTKAEREAARAADRARYRVRIQNEDSARRQRLRQAAQYQARGLGLPLDTIRSLHPEPIRTPWRSVPCEHCGALLLESEALSWCCRNGTKKLQPLPPLPSRIQRLVDESPIDVNSQSRALNYLFSLSAIGVSEHFTTYNGMIDVPTFHPFTETCHHDIFLGGGPYWLAMQGRTYHRIFSTDTTRHEHPAQWLLYDSSRRDAAAANRKIPPFMVNTVRLDLEQYNMLYDTYRRFAEFETDMEDAYIELGDPGTGDEIAALFHLGSAPYPTPRSLYVQRAHDASPTPVPILNALYEPMQYPLLFPHATPGWGPHLKSIGWTQRAYYQSRLLTEQRFKDFGRLACEWMCDMFSRTEDERLDYVQKGKAVEAQQFRTNVNGNESDDEDNDDEDEDIHSFTLPASFTGSPKFYANKVADALALARQRGKPDLMITATCNPNWPEIRQQLKPG